MTASTADETSGTVGESTADSDRGTLPALALVLALTSVVTLTQILLIRAVDVPANPVLEIGWRLLTVFVPFAVGIGVFFSLRERSFSASMPSVTDLGYVAAGVVTAYLVFAVYVAVTTTFAPEFAHFRAVDEGAVTPDSVVVGVLSIVTFSAVTVAVEEVFFRGIIQSYLQSVLGAAGAVTVASICFAWFHAWPLTFVSPPFVGALAYYVVMGIVFGLAYEMTDNLTVPFAVHGLFNAGPYAIALLTVI